jgi:hypothetical protein
MVIQQSDQAALEPGDVPLFVGVQTDTVWKKTRATDGDILFDNELDSEVIRL